MTSEDDGDRGGGSEYDGGDNLLRREQSKAAGAPGPAAQRASSPEQPFSYTDQEMGFAQHSRAAYPWRTAVNGFENKFVSWTRPRGGVLNLRGTYPAFPSLAPGIRCQCLQYRTGPFVPLSSHRNAYVRQPVSVQLIRHLHRGVFKVKRIFRV